jgi:hypothetical protein
VGGAGGQGKDAVGGCHLQWRHSNNSSHAGSTEIGTTPQLNSAPPYMLLPRQEEGAWDPAQRLELQHAEQVVWQPAPYPGLGNYLLNHRSTHPCRL